MFWRVRDRCGGTDAVRANRGGWTVGNGLSSGVLNTVGRRFIVCLKKAPPCSPQCQSRGCMRRTHPKWGDGWSCSATPGSPPASPPPPRGGLPASATWLRLGAAGHAARPYFLKKWSHFYRACGCTLAHQWSVFLRPLLAKFLTALRLGNFGASSGRHERSGAGTRLRALTMAAMDG